MYEEACTSNTLARSYKDSNKGNKYLILVR